MFGATRRQTRRGRTVALLTLLTALASACGGGGGGSSASSPPPAPTPAPPAAPPPPPPAPPPPPPPVAVNRAPVIVKPNDHVRGVVAHQFDYDASQGGTTFSDPDGDPITYTVRALSSDFAAMTTSGPRLSGTLPPYIALTNAVVTASDGRGGETADWFVIEAVANKPPAVANPNSALFTTAGMHVNRDLTQGGTTFTDADGDSLTYTVEMTSPDGRGLTVDGLRAVGSLSNEKLASFKITANDGFGGVTTDAFIVAIPDPLPGNPTLPSPGYPYADEDLPLQFLFRFSVRALNPFWDTATTQRNPTTNAGATLGRVLFYDKRLSILNTHSCASCHEQARSFTTGDRFPVGVLGVPLKRNALVLTNARYNFGEKYFADLRVEGLERLALLPIEDPAELGNLLPLVEAKLAATSFYPSLFEAAFGTPEITSQRIASAISQFVRSIITYRSRYDQARIPFDDPLVVPPPDPGQFLTPLEFEGEDLFFESLCFSCHSTELQTLDFPTNNGLDVVSTDRGIDGLFRIASLRNVAVSGPYMHDGRFATLREVIDHYDHGIQDSPKLSPQLRVDGGGPPRQLNLTEQQKDALEAFLNALTDDELLTDPRFSDPFTP